MLRRQSTVSVLLSRSRLLASSSLSAALQRYSTNHFSCVQHQFSYSASSIIGASLRCCSTTAATKDGASQTPPKRDKEPITVAWSVTPNPESLRFYSMQLSFLPPGSTLDIPNEGHAYKSPLAQMLFEQNGVSAIFISDEYVTVTKQPHFSWDELAGLVRNVIVEFAASDMNILSELGERELESGHPDTEPQPGDDDVVLAIKELLHTRIRPMLAGDGGGLKFITFDQDEGTVFLTLEGACRTCPSSGNTLKNGIERMLMHWCPEVQQCIELSEEDGKAFKEEMLFYKKQAQMEQEQREKAAAAGVAPGEEPSAASSTAAAAVVGAEANPEAKGINKK